MASPFERAPDALPLPQWEHTPSVLEAPPHLAYLLDVVEARERDLRAYDEELRARRPSPPRPPSTRPVLVLEPTPPGDPRRRRRRSRTKAQARAVPAALPSDDDVPWADPADVVELRPQLSLVPADDVPWANPADVVCLSDGEQLQGVAA